MNTVTHRDLVDLIRRFQDKKYFNQFRKELLSRVAEWKWATGSMTPELPYLDVVEGDKPDKWVKSRPKKRAWHHGLDVQGRILYACVSESDAADAEILLEQFWLHENRGFFWFPKRPKNSELGAAKWFEMDGPRLLRLLELTPMGIREKILRWEGDRYDGYEDWSWTEGTSRDLEAAENATLDPDKPYASSLYTYLYSADGELERVLESFPRFPQLKPTVQYARRPKGANLKSLLSEVEELLVERIPECVKDSQLSEPLYALLVQYTGVDTDPGGFGPPVLAVPEAIRGQMRKKHPNDPSMLWSGPDLEGLPGVAAIATASDALNEKLQLIFQLTIMPRITKYGPVRTMFQNVCRRLNDLDWSDMLQVTDDFIVLPFDPHGEMDLRKDLKTCVPSNRLQTLIDRGYVGRMKIG